MASTIDELVAQIRELEGEIETVYDKKREDLGVFIENGRVRFSEAVIAQQRLRKIGLLRWFAGVTPLSLLVSPVIYSGFIPLALLDLFCFSYQAICFPIYGIAKVRRSDYLALDRGDLPYLNPIQQFNCFYCSYANGLASYFREIAARTEQYFCPIKHARGVLATHDRYPKFFEYGDAETYARGLQRLQKELRDDDPA